MKIGKLLVEYKTSARKKLSLGAAILAANEFTSLRPAMCLQEFGRADRGWLKKKKGRGMVMKELSLHIMNYKGIELGTTLLKYSHSEGHKMVCSGKVEFAKYGQLAYCEARFDGGIVGEAVFKQANINSSWRIGNVIYVNWLQVVKGDIFETLNFTISTDCVKTEYQWPKKEAMLWIEQK